MNMTSGIAREWLFRSLTRFYYFYILWLNRLLQKPYTWLSIAVYSYFRNFETALRSKMKEPVVHFLDLYKISLLNQSSMHKFKKN